MTRGARASACGRGGLPGRCAPGGGVVIIIIMIIMISSSSNSRSNSSSSRSSSSSLRTMTIINHAVVCKLSCLPWVRIRQTCSARLLAWRTLIAFLAHDSWRIRQTAGRNHPGQTTGCVDIPRLGGFYKSATQLPYMLSYVLLKCAHLATQISHVLPHLATCCQHVAMKVDNDYIW